MADNALAVWKIDCFLPDNINDIRWEQPHNSFKCISANDVLQCSGSTSEQRNNSGSYAGRCLESDPL
jgi:hypothetical protein